MTTYNHETITSDRFRTQHGIIYGQIVLMYLPLIYVTCYGLKQFYTRVKRRYSGYANITRDDTDQLPELRDVFDTGNSSNDRCEQN